MRTRAGQARFPLPVGGVSVTWPAAQAVRRGSCEVTRTGSVPSGSYVRMRGAAGRSAIEFAFTTSEPVTLRVSPEWWRHGERKPAQRFPHPFASTIGPTALVALGDRVFFNAPAAGCVGVIQAQTETLLDPIDSDGYPVGLVADPAGDRCFVVDARSDRVLVLERQAQQVVAEIATPGLPWAAALLGERLFVACLRGRCIAVIDTRQGKVTSTLRLDAHPRGVSLVPGDRSVVRVELVPNIYDPVTLAEEVPDRFDYYLPSQREERPDGWQPPGLPPPTGAAQFRPRRRSAELLLPCHSCTWESIGKRFTSDTDHTLKVDDKILSETHVIHDDDPALRIQQVRPALQNTLRSIDVSAVTTGRATAAGLPFPLPDDPGPAALDRFGKLLLFVAPAAGRVGVLDMETEQVVRTLELGGYLTDLAVDVPRRKVYVCDALRNHVLVLDAERLEVLRTVAVPERPLSLTLCGDSLFVACHGGKCVAVIDRASGGLRTTKPLPAPPLEVHTVRLFPRYTFTEGGKYAWLNYLPADSDAPKRLLVHMEHATTFDAATLAPAAPPQNAPPVPSVLDAQAAGKSFRGEPGAGLICVDGQRWLDVSSVADPRRLPDSARLRPGDTPGTATLSLDGGPEHDWTRNVWADPDNDLLLDSGSPESRRWNAVTLDVPPGRHVLRVRSYGADTRLEGLAVSLAPPAGLALAVHAEPRDVHGQVPLSSYHGVFCADEPLRFSVSLANRTPTACAGTLSCEVRNFLGEVVFSGEYPVGARPGETVTVPVAPTFDERGVFRLALEFVPGTTGRGRVGAEDRVNAELRTGACPQAVPSLVVPPSGGPISTCQVSLTADAWFLRLPRLEYPRLLFRREDMPAIRRRAAEHRLLFKRYTRWLQRHYRDPGFFPKTLLAKFSERAEYLDVLAKWRVLACRFAAMFASDLADADRRVLAQAADGFLAKGYADQITFAHNWFRAALPLLFDLAASDSTDARAVIAEAFAGGWKDMMRIEEALLCLHEPLTPQQRLSLAQQVKWLVNVDRYFGAHAGRAGGNFYVSPHSLCVCPIFGTLGAMVLYRNVFGMPRLLERPHFAGWFTHYRYVVPQYDPESFFAHGSVETGGPITGIGCMDVKTMVAAIAMLTRHPVEKRRNAWDRWLAAAEAPGRMSDARIDELFGTGIGVCMPVFLALGWHEPGAPEADPRRLPPSALFDGEGEAVMNSGWDRNATSVYFGCGLRDVVPRHHAGHIQVLKAGRVLLGSPAVRRGDHAQPLPGWSNTVVVGRDWPQWWSRNIGHPRGMEERIVMNRYAPEFLIDAARADAFMKGRLDRPVRYGQCYTMGFSEHVQNPFMREGEILAFQTCKQFDYVAGDWTSAWTSEQVVEGYRQVLFLKPDIVVVYDRLELARDEETRWLAAAWRELGVTGNEFRVWNGDAHLAARVVLPRAADLCVTSTRDYGELLRMPVIEVHPRSPQRRVEYLVVLQVGTGKEKEAPGMTLVADRWSSGVRIPLRGGHAECRFRRTGDPGGRLVMAAGRRCVVHELEGGGPLAGK